MIREKTTGGMETYRGSAIIRQRGNDVFVQCAFDVKVESRSGLKGWSGSFAADAASPLEAGEAMLKLRNGSEGSIIINHLDTSTGQGSFVGSGKAPMDATSGGSS